MQPHQERVVAERDELFDKLTKLNAFMISGKTETVDPEEVARLKRQQEIMTEYVNILDERIGNF